MARVRRSGEHAPSHWVFFTLACLHAVISIPVWWGEWAGWLPIARTPHGHSHEMLLGYAAAVIGGFLFTNIGRPTLALAAGCWLAGRIASELAVGGWIETVAALAFPSTLGLLAGLPFLRSARSGRNLVFAPVILGFLLSEALYQFGAKAAGMALAFNLVTLLVLVMGGRILPAAMAGAVRLAGGNLANRNHPRLEQATIAGMAVAAAVQMFDAPGEIAYAGWIVAGAASLVRLSAWRFRVALGHPALWPLHLGYAWLGLGLIATASAGLTGVYPTVAVLHVVTVGGMGTVTITMMIRTIMLRDRLSCTFPRMVSVAIGLVALSAILRVAASHWAPLMAVAAIAWSAAFVLVLATLFGLYRLRTAGA